MRFTANYQRLSDVIDIIIPTTVSLAKRAGKVSSGESAVKESIRSGSAHLVLIAEDVSANTFKSITDSCAYYNVSYISIGTKAELGHSIGKEFAAAVAICDAGFAKSIDNKITANINGGEVL